VEAERRQITVLFTDMVGFTSFSERSGEEAAFTLMSSLWKLMAEAVREHGGVVQDFTGDGIMAVFGAPIALEDGPLRASRAALSILQRLKADAPDLEAKHGVRPQMRIGVNTGPAVVGKVDDRDGSGAAVLGDTVNFAARLQSIAEPNSVFISEATHQAVQGLVDAIFAGERAIKGKSELQKVYRLNAVRQGAARFAAAVSRGLSVFVGRERELDLLERELDKSQYELCVVDTVAEPGMGKSRLLYEFRERISKDRTFVRSASCSPDGQQTPFLPFIEIVRGLFRVSPGEAEKEVAQKLKIGLTTLSLCSTRNVGLLQHLLGLEVRDGALTGLDGMLIGLRTRELVQQLIEARCRLSPVLMIIEDLHWIDSASEELLRKLVESVHKLPLLLVTTRRPEYTPPWLDGSVVTKLSLEPLPVGDIRHLVQARLDVDALPDALARWVSEKAEGNPLFAEEIASFLTEHGILRTAAGLPQLDTAGLAGALPSNVQSLLTARVDRLSPSDRALLQAASVIGRQFDPHLLTVVDGGTDVNDRLAAMQALNLVRPQTKSNDYEFKHALVRDALYQSLLSQARRTLHLKIADEIERRGGNRLAEVAEVLAHHYSQTDQTDKAFVYLFMAGRKSLGIYSLEEATTHFTAGLALLDKNPNCASDDQVADFLVAYTQLLNMSVRIEAMINLLARYLPRVDRLGDDPRVVLIRHQYVFALLWNTRYREAAAMQRETSPIADRLGDSRSKAYSLAAELHVSTIFAPKTLERYEILKRDAMEAASNTSDIYIQNWIRWAVGWEEFHRSRVIQARESAHELMRVGQTLNDPRCTGQALNLLTWIALVSDSYDKALEYSEQCLTVAIAPLDRIGAAGGKGCALVLLRRTEEGAALLEDHHRRCIADGNLYTLAGSDAIVGVCKALRGNIRQGIRIIEDAILKREQEGYRDAADWYRGFLIEVYLQIIAGNERLTFPTLLRNLLVLVKVMIVGPTRIRALIKRIRENPHFDPAGAIEGRAQMHLGLLYKIKKKRALAIQHLRDARRILSYFGQTPILARVETALSEL
jgi:class 3 adenylate cyclase